MILPRLFKAYADSKKVVGEPTTDKQEKLDLYFVIDASKSVESAFDDIKKFIISVIYKIPVTSGQVRIAITLSGGTQYDLTKFSDRVSMEWYEYTISNMQLVGSDQASFLGGLERAQRSLSESAEDAKKVLILISGSGGYDDLSKEVAVANDIRKSGKDNSSSVGFCSVWLST